MRATSPPPALTVATAAIPIVAAVLALLATPSAALAARWLRPVPGEVARSFSYARAAPFARGAHRGVDLVAAPGTTARAACSGTVVHAGPVARRGGVVSMRCGTRRVSYLPLASLTVRAGAAIAAGGAIGTVAAGHGALHVGVRREADPFAYEDPMTLLVPAPPAGAPLPPAVRDRPRAPRPHPAPPLRRFRPRARAPRGLVPRLAPTPRVSVPRPAAPPLVAPWPVWTGLAMLLTGAAGSGTVVVRRRRARRAATTGAVAAAPRAT